MRRTLTALLQAATALKQRSGGGSGHDERRARRRRRRRRPDAPGPQEPSVPVAAHEPAHHVARLRLREDLGVVQVVHDVAVLRLEQRSRLRRRRRRGRRGVPGAARGGGRGVLGEVELGAAPAEAERGGVVRARRVLGGGERAKPHPRRLLRVTDLSRPFTPRPPPHTAILPRRRRLRSSGRRGRAELLDARAARHEQRWRGRRRAAAAGDNVREGGHDRRGLGLLRERPCRRQRRR
uniref:Uncharacterized protein n=1 Tax=Triticum urartu TaxID=4572 RepID=A0A8R7PFQ7_TRIUA